MVSNNFVMVILPECVDFGRRDYSRVELYRPKFSLRRSVYSDEIGTIVCKETIAVVWVSLYVPLQSLLTRFRRRLSSRVCHLGGAA